MRVLVVRHSIAVDPYLADMDEQRWLTGDGRRRARDVAAWLAEHAKPTHIYTSPLVRAVQTAELLGAKAECDDFIRVHPALSLEYGTTAEALEVLDSHGAGDTVALVSHSPKVRVLTGHLSGTDRLAPFHTCTVACVRFDGALRTLEWMLDPRDCSLAEL